MFVDQAPDLPSEDHAAWREEVARRLVTSTGLEPPTAESWVRGLPAWFVEARGTTDAVADIQLCLQQTPSARLTRSDDGGIVRLSWSDPDPRVVVGTRRPL